MFSYTGLTKVRACGLGSVQPAEGLQSRRSAAGSSGGLAAICFACCRCCCCSRATYTPTLLRQQLLLVNPLGLKMRLLKPIGPYLPAVFAFLQAQVENMTNKWHVYMTFDGRISMAGLSSAWGSSRVWLRQRVGVMGGERFPC